MLKYMIWENLKTGYIYTVKNFKHMIHKSYIINYESNAKYSLKYNVSLFFMYIHLIIWKKSKIKAITFATEVCS